jgi:hypothetical protein
LHFRYKNVCFECHGDLNCFLPLLHDYLRKMVDHMPINRWTRDWHFYPQSWYCDFDQKFGKYHLLRYERSDEFYTELVQVLRYKKVSDDLVTEIETKLKTKTAAHATFSASAEYERKLVANETLIEYVRKIYHLDFVWFGYRA